MQRITRRQLLRYSWLAGSGLLLAACQPKVVEVEKIVEKEVTKVVKEVVKETVVVKEAVEVPKEVTRVIEKVATVAPKEPVSIRLQRPGWSIMDYVQAFRKEFEERRPGIKLVDEVIPGGLAGLKRQYVMDAAANNLTDIVYMHGRFGAAQLFAYLGISQPVDDLIDRDGWSLSDYPPEFLDLFRYEGKLPGLPQHVGHGLAMLMCNVDAFEREGVELPKPDWTYKELMEAAKRLTKDRDGDGRIDQHGFWTAWEMGSTMAQLPAWGLPSILDSEGRKILLDGDEYRALLRFWLDCVYESKIVPPIGSGLGGLGGFQQGQTAMSMAFMTWVLDSWRLVGNQFRIEGFRAPLGPGGGRANDLQGEFWEMGGQTKHRDEAWEVIKFYLSEEIELRRVLMGMGVPVRRSVYESPQVKKSIPVWKDDFGEQVWEAKAQPYAWNYRGTEVNDVYNSNIDLIMLREVGIDPGIKKLVDEIGKVLAKPVIEAKEIM